MRIVVGGAGEVGYNVARALYEEGHDLAVIESDQDRIERLQDLDVIVIEGNAASRSCLRDAGIEDAELYIGCTGDDEVNMVGCALAKTYGCRTLARINSIDYLDQPYSDQYASMGIDMAVCPELVAAIRIGRLLAQPNLVAAEVFSHGKVFVAEGRVADDAFVVGKKVADVEPPAGFNLVAIYRGDDILIPGGSTKFEAKDRLLMVLTSMDVLKEVEPYIGQAKELEPEKEIRRIMIGGATRVGLHLARLLQGRRDVVLVEKDPALCELAGEQLHKALVVHGDVTDRNLLIQENVDTFDAFIGTEKAEEYNVMSCLIAKQLGVRKTVALITQPELKPLVETLGIDLAVAPRLSTVGALLKASHSDAENLSLLHQGEAQVLEVRVGINSPVAGKKIKRAHFPANSLVGAIVRQDTVLIPRGDDRIEEGDTLIVFALTEEVSRLERLF
ncbi:MAG: Trk system potassium transporter TrkA [Thermoplasmatota archaeon]